MEGQNSGVDTEEYVLAQHFDVPVLEVEGLVRCCSRRVDGRLVIRSVCDRRVNGRLIIRHICYGEVG